MPETLASWLDLTVPDAQRARAFYCAVLGTTTSAIGMRDAEGEYEDFCLHPSASPEAGALAGVCHARGPNTKVPRVWMPYFTVQDLEKAINEATQRGAEVLDGPKNIGGTMQVAFIRDPDGASFGLVSGSM